ncbi:MAG: magnesium transporter [Candidatus Omnitrophota bacterium]|jgi:magnesium transporter|nr:MAG: magnesium transporter [Candidatus Omnitrophota bacterium]
MLGRLIEPEIRSLLEQKNYKELRAALIELDPVDIAEAILVLSPEDRAVVFRLLPRTLAADVFEYLPFPEQEELLHSFSKEQVSAILNEMAPDDRTALLEELPGKVTRRLLGLMSPEERIIATNLLGYPEDSIGRLMTPEYITVKEDWPIKKAFKHIRRTGPEKETINVIYVIDENDRLVDDLTLKKLIFSNPNSKVADLMDRQFIALQAHDDQETAIEIMARYDRFALPVVDSDGTLVGIVTSDDIFDVVEEENTEDIQKLGGVGALEDPYSQVGILTMVRKRTGWLSILFLGGYLTSKTMGVFENQITSEVWLWLTLFLPLIISSGGNSGSQAATLVIRAMAVQDIEQRDWFRILLRETGTGMILGLLLGMMSLFFFYFLPASESLQQQSLHSQHFLLLGITVASALISMVIFGTLIGSMLPFIFNAVGVDPALSSTPFVATLVDITGVVIYFSLARVLLAGTLL